MQSKAATVDGYLTELPEDRREAIEGIRKVILKNLPKWHEEGMLYGMIGYYVPHSIYPDGYHLSLIHICRCLQSLRCRSRWSPYH